MAKEIGNLNVVVGLDSTGFQNGIGQLNREMRKVQSEFRLASTELGKHGTALDGLKLKSNNLTNQTELQRQKVQALEAAHQKSVETKGADAKATQELETKLNNAKTQLSRMEQELQSVNQEIKLQSSSWQQLSQALAPVGEKMQEVGKSMQSIGKDLTTKVTLPLVGLGAAAVKVGSDFEAGMSEVAAISGATGNDLKKLEEKAKEMGATTKFSASESADALKYMAMAGWDTNQMLDGLDGIMMLAASSGEDLGRVSDIVTDALTAFGMEARQAGEFADLLASASSNSNTNVGLLGESFKYVAPLFGAMGYSAEDAALALGLMANAGIKGSQSGTSLKTAIANLANPTDKMKTAMSELGISITDANGEMLPFKDVMDELRGKFSGLTEEQQAQYAATIFGKEAMSGMLAIINASDDDYEKLTQATREYNGVAKEMADVMIDNLQGGLTILKSGLEGVGIQIFEILLPHLQKLVEKLQQAVDWFSNLNPKTQETIVMLGLVAAAIGPILLIGGKLIAGIGTAISVISTVSGAIAVATTGAAVATPAIGALATVFTVLTGPVGIAVAAITALTVAGVALYKHLSEESIPEVQLFGDEVSESTKKAVGGFLELNDEATLALNQLSWSGQEVTKEMADGINNNFSQMASQIQVGLDEHHEASLSKIQGFVDNSTSLSKQEQEEILNDMKEGHEIRKQTVADGEARIKEILETASTEKRAITKAEQEEINDIQKEMVETGIQVLSENEVEAKSIMERMKAQASEITATQAAEVVKNSLEQKEKTVQNAEEQYDEVVKEIIRQRDDTVKQAESMHENVIKEAKSQAKEHVNQVDWETGEIKTKWQVMKSDIATKASEIKQNVINRWEEIKSASSEKWNNVKTTLAKNWSSMKTDTLAKVKEIKADVTEKWEAIRSSTSEKWALVKGAVASSIDGIKTKITEGINKILEWNATSVKEKVFSIVQKVTEVISKVTSGGDEKTAKNFSGTSFFQGGWTMVGELGPELVKLPTGSQIYNDSTTKKMMSGSKGITQYITINSPAPLSPTETARQLKNTSRRLAMEW